MIKRNITNKIYYNDDEFVKINNMLEREREREREREISYSFSAKRDKRQRKRREGDAT